MIKLMKYLSFLQWICILVIIVFTACQVYLDLLLPDYMAEIISIISASGTTSEIWNVGFIMLGIALLSSLCTIVASWLASYISAGLCRTIRQKMFDSVQSFSMAEMNKFSTASLITRSTNDITQIQQVYGMGLRLLFVAPIMAGIAISKIVGKSSELSWVTAGFVVLMLLGIITMFLIVTPKFTKMQKKVDKLNSVTREELTGVRVIRAFNNEKLQTKKFEDANNDYSKINLFVGRAMAMLNPFMNIIMSGLSLAIVWFGCYLVGQSMLGVEQMMAFTQYATMVLVSFLTLTMFFAFLPRSIVSAKRIREVLACKTTILDGEGANFDDTKKGEIEFDNVSFSYDDAKFDVLKNISFKAKKGETVAIIGSTGSGKSTLINLIPRFYDVTKGAVKVNGVDVRKQTLHELRDSIGYVPQRGALFSGSIESNVNYGIDNVLSSEEMQKVLEISQSAEFVNKYKDKEKHHIAQDATNISGGQKQRLSIARALAKNSDILIFDDSFSALDFKTDRVLRNELKEKVKDVTKIIVAQRIGTVMDADQIIVLENGEMVGKGTHKELMKSCEVYRKLAYSQLSKKELSV